MYSHAGPNDGLDPPEDITILNIHEHEESHGSPEGEPGVIFLWDGGEYDRDDSWIMCHEDATCNLDTWL